MKKLILFLFLLPVLTFVSLDESKAGDMMVPFGACCIDGGEVCEFMEAQGCDGDSIFIGVGETCEPNPCLDEVPAPGPTVTVPTMGQWGIIFASIVLGAFGIVAIIRERNMGRYMDE